MLVNALRGHMAELGIIAPQGISRVGDLVAALIGEYESKLPKLARYALRGLAAELEALGERVKEVEGAILAWHKDNEASLRLATIPGIGPITASAIVATVTDPTQFHSPCVRGVAAGIGLANPGVQDTGIGSLRTTLQGPRGGASAATGEFGARCRLT